MNEGAEGTERVKSFETEVREIQKVTFAAAFPFPGELSGLLKRK